jgi:hypothetical protein
VADLVESLTPERAVAVGAAALERVRDEHSYALRGEQVDRLFRDLRARMEAAA